MNATTKLAIIAAAIALVGGSLFMPGPTEVQVEQSMSDWKQEVIEMAQKDHDMLKSAGAFTK
jgi:hypothetical protein